MITKTKVSIQAEKDSNQIEKMADDFAEVLDKALKKQREEIVRQIKKIPPIENEDPWYNDPDNIYREDVIDVINHINK